MIYFKSRLRRKGVVATLTREDEKADGEDLADG